jgi:hypothetical protein
MTTIAPTPPAAAVPQPQPPGAARLVDRFGIDEESIAWRHKAVFLEESDRVIMLEMTPRAKAGGRRSC